MKTNTISLIEDAIDEIDKRHSYYKPTLKKLTDFPIYKQIKIKDLEPTRGVMQKAYKEMEKDNFEGNIIDYFCWISLSYLVPKIMLTGIVSERVSRGKEPKNLIPKWINKLLITMVHYQIDSVNSIRLYLKDENYLKKALDKYIKFESEEDKKTTLDYFIWIFERSSKPEQVK